MPFFKELRRRRTGTKAEKSSSKGTKTSNGSNVTVPTTKSTSTLNSVYGSSTPPSSIQPHQSTPNLLKSKSASTMTPSPTPLPQRPMPLSSVSNRSSFMVGLPYYGNRIRSSSRSNQLTDVSLPQGLNAPSINGTITPKASTSAFAPRILTISDNSWVRIIDICRHFNPLETPDSAD